MSSYLQQTRLFGRKALDGLFPVKVTHSEALKLQTAWFTKAWLQQTCSLKQYICQEHTAGEPAM